MKLYGIEGNILKSISTNPFLLEKDIQKLIENNVKELFDLEFVKQTDRSSARFPKERYPGNFSNYMQEQLIREKDFNFDVSPADPNFFQLERNTAIPIM